MPWPTGSFQRRTRRGRFPWGAVNPHERAEKEPPPFFRQPARQTSAGQPSENKASDSEISPAWRLDLRLVYPQISCGNRGGLTISQGQEIGADNSGPAVSLLFASGRRPDPEAIRRLAQQDGGFSISLDPSEEPEASGIHAGERVWLELLVNGLTFDLLGLAPGPSCETPPHVHRYVLAADFEALGLEAVTLRLGPHIAGGRATPPVVRSLAQLGATLSGLAAVEAVAWHPARTLCGPDYFRGGVQRWIGGGVFPALGLTALAIAPDGGMQSEGLALFIGQELRLEPELMRDRGEGAKIGVRLIDYLVELGRVDDMRQIDGPDGQPLRLEPSANGRFVRVWRG